MGKGKSDSMDILQSKRIVIKIGSSLIFNTDKQSVRGKWLDSLAEDIAHLRQQGIEVAVVSSGAVAMGRQSLNIKRNTLKLEEKQAAAACGQSELVRRYKKYLKKREINVAQILITLFDSENRRNYLNVKNTIEVLLENGVVPIINENDTVATHELRVGDNDRLAARVAQMIGADTLILFSDIDGLYTTNPKLKADAEHIKEITEITQEVISMGGRAMSSVGSGGMVTKIEAAKIAMDNGCNTIITSGRTKFPIKALIEGAKATYFIANESPFKARKKWIAGHLKVSGEIVIDNGALKALDKGSSLLPAGVIDIFGEFDRGDLVVIKNYHLMEVGRGLTAYSSEDARLIMGQQSTEIEHMTGFSGRNELIHRDDMVFTGLIEQSKHATAES